MYDRDNPTESRAARVDTEESESEDALEDFLALIECGHSAKQETGWSIQ